MSRREPDLSRLREILIRYKGEAGLTYDDLADRTGLARSTLTNIGRGTQQGNLRTWLLLADALDVPLGDLLEDVWVPRSVSVLGAPGSKQ